MPTKKKKTDGSQDKGIQTVDSLLTRISARLAELEGGKEGELLAGLDECLEQADQAQDLAIEGNQPWLAAWIALQKASLHSDLAEFSSAMGRAVQVHTSMNLILETAESIPDLPPDLDRAASLYLTLIGVLLRIRTFFEEKDQLQAVDGLIQGCAETLGQLLAHSQALKAEAADLLFTARILEALDDLEVKSDQGGTSRDLDRQAAALLGLAGGHLAQLSRLSGEGQ